MTKRLFLGMSVILSTAIAAPVFAQAVVQEPDAYALYLPKVGAETGSAPSQGRDAHIVSHDRDVSYDTDDATASAPSAHFASLQFSSVRLSCFMLAINCARVKLRKV